MWNILCCKQKMGISKFFYFFDLRRGCITYAWLQMMFVITLTMKLTWISDLITHADSYIHVLTVYTTLVFSILAAIQIIKGLSDIALIWGIIKNSYMFYQPWLFINGFENSLLILISGLLFIIGCMEVTVMFYFFLPFIILAVFGWYVWSCVYVVYKRDIKPSPIAFDTKYENFNLDNITVNA